MKIIKKLEDGKLVIFREDGSKGGLASRIYELNAIPTVFQDHPRAMKVFRNCMGHTCSISIS